MGASQQVLSDVYRVIVFRQNGAEVLVVSDGIQYRFLPVEISRDQRVAETVSAQFRRDCGEEIICISSDDDSECQIAEHWRNIGNAQKQTKWTAVESLSKESFVEHLEYERLEKAIQKVREPKGDNIRGPFAQLGWFKELCAWADTAAGPVGIQLNGNFRQLNASESFSLIRFETNGPALWFKAVGQPNQREFPITMTLAKLFPDYLPLVLASHDEWNGWLMHEVEGDALEPQDLRSCSIGPEATMAGHRNVAEESMKKRSQLFQWATPLLARATGGTPGSTFKVHSQSAGYENCAAADSVLLW